MWSGKQSAGKPYPLGVSWEGSAMNIAACLFPEKECGMILYHKQTNREWKIPFTISQRIGDIYCTRFQDFPYSEYEYNFYQDDKIVVDPYAKRLVGNEVYHPFRDTSINAKEVFLKGCFVEELNPFPSIQPLEISYSDAFIYCLHVRGFTKHASSKVKGKGTFQGIIEKIPYFKELGVTTIELMPAYEFLEDLPLKEHSLSMELACKQYKQKPKNEPLKHQFNYWGFQEGYYFAPKASYSYTGNPILEFQTMVHELHKNGLELIMQFYFPDSIQDSFILEVLKYWVYFYQVDGFRLKGSQIPLSLIAKEPMLSHTKLMYDDVSEYEIYGNDSAPSYKNIAYCNDDYAVIAKRFLKGDNDCLYQFQQLNRTIPEKIGVVRSIANYYGFRLADMVSYEQKHNEANGEDNRDGVVYNHSWNCGAEGPTRKSHVNQLRQKQMKNALCMLFTAQGTPFLMSGDEFGHTQLGNNNPYNQDNEVNWLNWKWNVKQKELFEFTKSLAKLRRENQVLHKAKALSSSDLYHCGYPEISYHMEELWRVDYAEYQHHIGILYTELQEGELTFLYYLVNMHWNEHSFAIPRLKAASEWSILVSTNQTKEGYVVGSKLEKDCSQILLPERSTLILQCKMKRKMK